MKKLLILLPLVLLTGCPSTIVMKEFPEAPENLMIACPDLKQVDMKETKLSGVLDVIIENYSSYQECKVKVDSWIDWYNQQKKIHNAVN